MLVRGPWVCSEYYRDPQPEKFHDGWLVTGDVGAIDEERYLVIADRSKDLVKSGGEWISSVDLENHIVALDGVALAAVVAPAAPPMGRTPGRARGARPRRGSGRGGRAPSLRGAIREVAASRRRPVP